MPPDNFHIAWRRNPLWGNVMIPELKIKLSYMGLDYSTHCLPHRRTESRVLSPQDHISAPRACASVKPVSRFGLGREFLCSLGRAGKDCQGFGWCPPQCRLWSPKSPGWFKPWATFFLIHLNSINLCGMANLLPGFRWLTSDCICACQANRQTASWPGFSTQVGLCIPLFLFPRHPNSLSLPAEIKL